MTADNERQPLLVNSNSNDQAAVPTRQTTESEPTKSTDSLDDPQNLSKPTQRLIFSAIFLAVFLGALDTTVVSTLVNEVSADFHQSNKGSWLATSYLLSTATFTPLYGRLADILGRRGASLIALFLFTVGTLLCGVAPTMEWLIAGRLIAGMGGGGIMTVASVICSDLVPLKRRGYIQGVSNLFFGAGGGLGGPVGGFISDRIGWRYSFLFQVPLLAIVILLVYRNVRYTVPGQGKSKSEMIRRIDYGGSIGLIISLGALLFGLSSKNNDVLPWSDPRVWAPLVVFAGFAVAFVLWEALGAAEPVMPFYLLKQRNPLFVCLTNFHLACAAFGVLFFYPIFFEVVKQQSASRSGAHLLVNSASISAGSLFAGYVIRQTGTFYKVTVVACILPVITLVGMSFLDQNTGPFLQWALVIPGGFGYASALTSVLIAMMASVERHEMPTSTGMGYLFRYIGQVVGVAASFAILQAVLTSRLRETITGPGAAQIIDKIRRVSTSIADLTPEHRAAAISAYQEGLRVVFIFNAVLAFICFLCCLPIQERPLPGTFKEEEEVRRRRDLGDGSPTRA
ncbi:MFS general substrate transporter [Meredithblackwellia eburnea MCA 4105]